MAENTSADVGKILSTIREVESNNNYTIGSKSSSASGAYQFIDDTWRRYTNKFGVGSEYPRAKDAPPEVQDQVASLAVSDILRQVGGDVSKVPLVWYTGNPQGQMTEAALKANQGLTPDKYQQKWLSVFNKGATTKVAQAPAQAPRTTAPEPRTTEPGVQVAAAFNPMELPASYTSALALNYLSDTDPEGVTMSKVNEMLADMMEDGGGAATRRTPGAAALQQYAQAEQVDPFAIMRQAQEAQQPKRKTVPQMPQTPQMFALGGSVSSLAQLAGPTLLPSEKAYLKAQQEEGERYNKAVEDYNKKIEDYRKSIFLNPEGTEARIYEKVSGGKFNWSEKVRDPLTGTVYEPGQYYMTQDGDFLLARQNPTATIELNKVLKSRGTFAYIDPRTGKEVAQGTTPTYGTNYFVQGGKLYEFATEPTGPEPTTTLDTAKVEQYQKDAARRAAQRNTALKYAMGVAPQNTSGVSGFSFGFAAGGPVGQMASAQPIEVDGFAHGGIVHRQAGSPPTGEVADIAEQMTVGTIPTEGQIPAGQAFRNIGRDVVRGAQYLPYDLLGAPVDIINMGLTPFGLGSQRPVGGSEYLIEKARQAGIADQPTGSAAETATRIGMGFVNPAAVARQLGRGIEGLTDVVTAPIDRAKIRAAASRAPEDIAYDPLRERLESQGILSLATRPGGSIMFGDETSRSLLNQYAQSEMPKAGTAFSTSFLDYLPKIDKYMQSQFSTPNDPLLIATVEGRFKPKPFLRPNDLFSYDRKEISEITEIPLQDKTKLTPAHVDKLLELSKAGNEKAQKIVFRGAGRTMNTSGQITVPQIVDKLKNTEFFDEVKASLKSAVESTFWKELGKEEDIVPLMKKYISQKGIPNEQEQEQHAFNTLGFRVSTLLEAKADAEKKLQAKNPLFGEYPTSISVVDLAETPSMLQKLNKAAENIPGMAEEISRGKPIYRYSTTWGSPFRTEDIFEYMSENDPAKWSKMSVPELIIASSAKDPASVTNPAKIARMADDGDPLTADQLRTGTQRYMPVNSATLGEGAEWREITTKEGLRIEGGVLQHCLKRETSGYCNRLLNKESKYFTLRDADGQPYVSIELAKPIGKEKEDVPYSVIKQVKGFRNTNAIPLYGEEVSDFLMDWQKKSGVKLSPTEDNDFLPQKFKQKTSFGIEAPPENFRKGGMVDKPLYDRAM